MTRQRIVVFAALIGVLLTVNVIQSGTKQQPPAPQRAIGPIDVCQETCCFEVGGTPQERPDGLVECEMNDNDNNQIFALKLAQFEACDAGRCR